MIVVKKSQKRLFSFFCLFQAGVYGQGHESTGDDIYGAAKVQVRKTTTKKDFQQFCVFFEEILQKERGEVRRSETEESELVGVYNNDEAVLFSRSHENPTKFENEIIETKMVVGRFEEFGRGSLLGGDSRDFSIHSVNQLYD